MAPVARFFYFAYGAAVTEVVIDTLTGENRILRADLLHDTGSSLNPALDIGQVEGAYVQGAGWLTTEELVWDRKGRLSTHAPSTYKIPACSDRPRIFNVGLWNRPNPENSVGKSKAVGEPPFMLGISALYALSDAVAACGDGSIYPEVGRAPATAERVLTAVKAERIRAGMFRPCRAATGHLPRTAPSPASSLPHMMAAARARWGQQCLSGLAANPAPSAGAHWNMRPP